MRTISDPTPGGMPMPETPAPDAEQAAHLRVIRGALLGILLLLAVAALYFGRDFFMPVVLAFLLAMTLTPVVRFLNKRGIPSPVSATMLVLVAVVGLAGLGYLLSGPVANLIDDAPRIGAEVSQRLIELRRPFDRMLALSQQIGLVTESTSASNVQRVVLDQPGFLSRAADNAVSAGTTVTITFVLALFLLASGPMFYQKIVQSFTRLSEKKLALRVVYDVEREISRYLFTIALINFGLGTVIGTGLWLLGMPNPLVWGVAAAMLNFLPYIGALITIVLVAAISLITFAGLGYALLLPAFVFLCDVIEGQFLTPMIVGRRLEINAVAVFVAVAFWTWLWGFIGALIAVPILVIVKVFCDHFEGLHAFGNFLAAQSQPASESEAATPVRAPPFAAE